MYIIHKHFYKTFLSQKLSTSCFLEIHKDQNTNNQGSLFREKKIREKKFTSPAG